MGLIDKLKIGVSAYKHICIRKGWGYQFLVLVVGLFVFSFVFTIFMELDSWFGITNNVEYTQVFFNVVFIVSIGFGVISILGMSYEIVSRGWI